MSASQNPAADYLPESRRQRNLKTRSPEIHFPAGSRNPFAQIHKSSPTCSRDFASENMQQTRNPVISSMPATDRHIVQPSQHRGSHPKPLLQGFFNYSKSCCPPLVLNPYIGSSFLADFLKSASNICCKKFDKVRRRSVETMSNIPLDLDNTTLQSFVLSILC